MCRGALLPAGTGKATAYELHLGDHGLYAGNRGCVAPSRLKVIVLPNISAEVNHTSVNRDVDVPRIDSRIREQRGLYPIGNVGIGNPFRRSSGGCRRTRSDSVCGHKGHQCLQNTVWKPLEHARLPMTVGPNLQ
jgi:hypothetical protein